ncbi:MAG: hypothetical protein WCT15_07680, partial [Candidatus Omnitrophota bacterium]
GTEQYLYLYNVIVNAGKSVTDNIYYTSTSGSAFTVNGTFTVGDGKYVSFSNSNQTLTIGDGGLLQGVDVTDSKFLLGGDSTPTITLTGTGNFGSYLYLIFNLFYIYDYALPSLNYKAGKVEISSWSDGGNTITVTPTAGTLDIDGDLILNCSSDYGGDTLNFSNSNNTAINIGGSFTRSDDYGGGVTKYTKGTTDTITFDGVGTQNFDPGTSSSFNNITINKSAGIVELITALDVDGELKLQAGTLDANGLAITCAGNWNNTGGTFTHGNNTVTFNGDATGKTINAGSSAFYILTINSPVGTGYWTLDTNTLNATTINVTKGTLNTSSVALGSDSTTINVNGGILTGGAGLITAATLNVTAGTFTAGSGGVDLGSFSTVAGTSGNYTHTGGTVDWITNSSLLHYYTDVDRVLPADTYFSVTLDPASTLAAFNPVFTLAGTTTMNGNLNIDPPFIPSTVTLNVAANSLTVNGYLSIGSVGTLTITTGSVTVVGNWINNAGAYGSFIAGTGTIIFNGNTTISGASINSFYNVIINNGKILIAPAANMNVSGNWTNNGGTFTPGTGTVTFSGSAAQAINGTAATQTFYNFTISKSAGTLSASGSTTAITVSGDFRLTSGTFSAPINVYVAGSWIKTGGTFTHNSRTVTFNGDATGKTINAGSSLFNILTINSPAGTGSWTLDTNSVNLTTLNVTKGTLNTGTLNLYASTINVNGGILSGGIGLIRTTTLNVTGGTLTAGSGGVQLGWGTNGSYTHSGGAVDWTTNNALLSWMSDTDRTIPADTYHSIQLWAKDEGGETFSLGGSIIVEGDLTIADSLTTLSAGTNNLTVGGNWTNSGTFTCGTGTVTFNGTVDQTLSGTLNGLSGKFYNFIMYNTGASGNDDVILGADIDISGNLTLTDGDLNLG